MEYDESEFPGGRSSKSPHGTLPDASPSQRYGSQLKPRLERYLGFLPMLAFAATLRASWEAIGASMYAGLENGGPVALIYGLMLTIIGSLGIAISLAELASITLVAEAQYHWTYDLAPFAPRFLSLIQGKVVLNGVKRHWLTRAQDGLRVVHMAKEIKDAPRVVPRSMVYSVLINGIVSLGFTIGLLYIMGGLKDALETPTGYLILAVFYAATKSNAAASVMLMMFVLSGLVALFNGPASVTRLT
ncbi:hypothetical protein BBP40_007308 [Aspergillus hancockii]|nr:hypothetical protein BBP40_007308 [Aspergillus hancockii]